MVLYTDSKSDSTLTSEEIQFRDSIALSIPITLKSSDTRII